MPDRRTPSPVAWFAAVLALACLITSLAVLKPANVQTAHPKGTFRNLILDVSLFQAATLSYAFLVTSPPYNSGVGTEIMNNGSLSRGVKEFFSFWNYETHYQVGNTDPNKTKKTFCWHPLLAYEYNNFLMAKGYSRKRSVLTSFCAIYVFEKGLQGSFETPSMYDFFSYASGITTSVLIQSTAHRLYEQDNLLLKGLGLALNPFFLIHS